MWAGGANVNDDPVARMLKKKIERYTNIGDEEKEKNMQRYA